MKHKTVIGCCIRLHNYFVDKKIEMEDLLQQTNGMIEVKPGLSLFVPHIDRQGSPTVNLHRYVHCKYCRYGLKIQKKQKQIVVRSWKREWETVPWLDLIGRKAENWAE